MYYGVITVGYKILYMPKEKDHSMDGMLRRQALVAAALLLGCYLVGYFWPAGREMLRQFLLPCGDQNVIWYEEAALQSIVSSVTDWLHGV